jgi:hypothetical protein
MAQSTLIGLQITEGQRLIERLVQEGIPITAAAWVKEYDSGDWYLYIATPLVSRNRGTGPAYRPVNTVIRAMEDEGFGLDFFDKKLLGVNDPRTKDILAHRKGRPGGPPTPFRGARLGNLAIDEAYIYPPLPPGEEGAGGEV